MSKDSWPSEWLRGVLGPALLSIVAGEDAHGYLISQRLEEAGLGRIKGGTLYPILSRYESSGLLTASWREGEGGPGRKVFSITPKGREELHNLQERWTVFSARAGAVINAQGEKQ
ncbi:PadR family transcriptional regulator [Nesterenkonia muleiensis]|uniref:PadR family transcriptional regulator n=1 Tax=Nesterenkonia muleiensis TaxID=2282648 RepID=UPI000E75B4E8|nr:PadR family transcriptional regulator [Nesterenkonia muleiensis]